MYSFSHFHTAHYKVLGIDRKSSGKLKKADVKKAYRQRSLLVHPDKNGSPEAVDAFKVYFGFLKERLLQ